MANQEWHVLLKGTFNPTYPAQLFQAFMLVGGGSVINGVYPV